MTLLELEPLSLPPEAALRVVVVDDHRILREGLSRALCAFGLAVVGEAGCGSEALRLTTELLPDVVLMDVSLPDLDGIAVVRQLRECCPDVRVVMLTMFGDRATMRDARNAGAVAYVTKDSSTSDIVAMVRRAGAQERPPWSDNLPPADTDHAYALSRREIEVLQLVAEGKATPAVARDLYISVKTVKNHLGNIYEKLDVGDRTQAVVQGLRLGLVHLR